MERLLAVAGLYLGDLELRHAQPLPHEDGVLRLPLQPQLLRRLGDCNRERRMRDRMPMVDGRPTGAL